MSPDQLTAAQEAIQAGEVTHARRLVAQILRDEPANEQAWLMMVRLVDQREQVVYCLQRASKINPENKVTLRALTAIQRSHPAHMTLTTQPAQPGRISYGGAVPSTTPIALQKPGLKTTQLELSEEAEGHLRPPKRKINWSLLIGSIIVLIVIMVAVIGPKIAPQDPLAEHAILQVGSKWVIPPFAAFQVPGYLLGSDQFGRDMLSRILYAIRPTLVMVTIVAMVRLFLGTLIGLGAGWSNGRAGHILDVAISAALAVPVLLVALGAITMLGTNAGLLTFIIGLSINGWGETARFVREQTQLIKGQLYIESARSLGSSSLQILIQHILRQIMPMIWMLFAFEISGTLMVTAGLGFLGYYIGGDVWIEVADFVSRRTSGAPELGQMLATSWINLLQPWPLVLTGSVVFLTVLGFNLFGEGLRSRLNPEHINRTSFFAIASHRFRTWFEEKLSYPVSNWLGASRLRPALVSGLILALVGSIYLYQTTFANRFTPAQAALTVPGGQLWAAERVDPYGTSYMNSIGPQNPQLLWIIQHPAGFSGSPTIAADGTIYIAESDGKLLALNPDGSSLWEVELPKPPSGPLALSPSGIVYITDSTGGLTAVNSAGNILWTYSIEAFGKPSHGAIVAPSGTIYYLLEDPRGDTLTALNPDGQQLWSVQPGTRAADTGLRLTPDSQQIFDKDVIINALDGSKVDITLPTQGSPILSNQAQLFVGADGNTYLLAGHIVMQWIQTNQGFSLVQSADWNYRSAGMNQNSGLPSDAGVTPRGNVWLFYSGFYGNTSVYWLGPKGAILGSASGSLNQGVRLVAVDGNGTAYSCGIGFAGSQGQNATLCDAYRAGTTDPIWTYLFPEGTDGITGAAMAPGRMYIITQDGSLTALGDGNNAAPAQSPTP
jgi:peptide/nickel transport system permease protein